MQVTLVQCSPRLMGRSYEKSSVFLSGTNRSKIARMSKSQKKTKLVTFFGIRITVHYQYIPQGQTVHQTCYADVLKWLRGTVHR
jgi:hypothetical protein